MKLKTSVEIAYATYSQIAGFLSCENHLSTIEYVNGTNILGVSFPKR
jgi:hypothetical protein